MGATRPAGSRGPFADAADAEIRAAAGYGFRDIDTRAAFATSRPGSAGSASKLWQEIDIKWSAGMFHGG
jgi:hypothetical protein